MCSDNNSSARDLQIVPLPKQTKLNTADTRCHTMPQTHQLVESKKLLKFCMGIASEQTGQQHESTLESDNFGLADQNILSEDPYTAGSSQEPHSMGGRSLLHDLESDYVNADLKHNQYGLESGHRVLSPVHSLNEEPSLNCSTEVPNFVGDPLLEKDTLQTVEDTKI